MDRSTADALVTRQRELGQAQVVHGMANRDKEILRIPLDLSVERTIDKPFRIGFPFRCLFFETANSPAGYFFLRPTSDDSSQSHVRVNYRDSWSISGQVPQAFLHWPAQPGVKAELVLFTDSDFRSGSQISITAGGVAVSEGASASLLTPLTLAAATATEILPQDILRKVGVIENATGGVLFIGADNTVTDSGATEGMSVLPGDRIIWRNTGALWAYSVAGGKVKRFREE